MRVLRADEMQDRVEKSRALRKDRTEAEDKLWQFLRNSHTGHKFRRQVPIGPYTVDFVCGKLKLVVEVDGGQHCENKSDERRTKFLNDHGYEVIRFWNNEVMDNVEGVVSTLTLALSHKRERGQKASPEAKGNK